MRTLRTQKPGQWGTKGLLARHGASLLCVRYRPSASMDVNKERSLLRPTEVA